MSPAEVAAVVLPLSPLSPWILALIEAAVSPKPIPALASPGHLPLSFVLEDSFWSVATWRPPAGSLVCSSCILELPLVSQCKKPYYMQYVHVQVSVTCSCHACTMCSPSSLPTCGACRRATLMLRKCLQPSLPTKAFV